jgi:hypothetical protein
VNSLIRIILAPFASAATGAIVAIFIGLLLFGIQDRDLLKVLAFIGAIFGAAPDILRLISDFTKIVEMFQGSSTRNQTATSLQAEARVQEKELLEKAEEQEARKKLLVEEHEARRPICTHCSKKTEPIYTYRKINGEPDMRHRNNPILCNKCFKPYSGVRPWKLPQA